MIKCPKCGKQLRDGSKFCDRCGSPIYKTVFCPNCGKQTSTEFDVCQNCGASIEEKAISDQTRVLPAGLQKPSRKKIIYAGIGIVALIVIIFMILLFGGKGGKTQSNYALYLKDGEFYFNNLKKDSESWQLTSSLFEDYDMDEEDIADNGFSLGYCTYMSADGKYIFFLDKINNSDEGFSLYYKKVGKPKSEAVKIDSNIQFYRVDDSATTVTYLKGVEGNLYQYKIAKDSKDKVATEAKGFEVSDDGKKISYMDFEGNLYVEYIGKEREKISSNVSKIPYVSKNLDMMYYIRDNSLYKWIEDAEEIKIASDIYSVIRVYDSGEMYYLKENGEDRKVYLKDYVVDDMKDNDAVISEPIYPNTPDEPDRPYWWEYDTDEQYKEAYSAYEEDYKIWKAECDRINTEYNAAREAYTEKVVRDELRADIQNETLDKYTYTLCYYNGTEEVAITDTFRYTDFSCANDTPILCYEAYDQSKFEKIRLSEAENVMDIKNMVSETLSSSTGKYIAIKEADTAIEQKKEARDFTINSSGTVVYYIDDITDEKNHGTLYRISISDGKVGKPEVYDEDVYIAYIRFVNDTDFVYFKEYENGKGELYMNKNKIDYDVENCRTDELGRMFYYTDWDWDKETGTLKMYDGKDIVKISDDVHEFQVIPDGRILYLYDYSINYNKGELYEWSDGKTREIDDDVIYVVPIMEDKYRGYSFTIAEG